jgi:hypothetical protein
MWRAWRLSPRAQLRPSFMAEKIYANDHVNAPAQVANMGDERL